MAQAQRYKLKLSKLQFCSLVDEPAQPNAKTLLIKRKGASDDITATARLAKVNDELGLAFFWAFTSTNKDGSDHYDLQGDQVTEFIKAAMDYMTETGGAVDIMHNGVAGDDRVVFAMPMDPEIGAAYGYVGKQTGLMVAVKPTAENLAKLKSGELNGVSIGGLGERVPVGKAQPSFAVGDHVECLVNHMPGMKGMTGIIVIAREGTPPYYGVKFDDQDAMPGVHKWLAQDEIKAAPSDAGTSMPGMKRAPLIRKEAVLTSTDDGHAHSISLDDPTRYWCDQLQTSYQNAAGADGGHSHAWIFDPTSGAITVADDSGHGHTVTAAVPADVLALYATREKQRDLQNLTEAATPVVVDDDQSDGICTPVTDEESSGKVSVVVVQARAPQNKSTPRNAMPHGGLNTEKSQMDKDKQIADLTAKNAELEKRAGALSKMSAVAFAVFKSLTGEAAEAFLAKSDADRAPQIAEFEKGAAIEYTALDGTVYRKSDDPRMVTLAKRADEERTARLNVELAKRASDTLGNLAGADEAHIELLKAVELIPDEKKREAAKTTLKAANDAMAKRGVAKGIGGGNVTDAEMPGEALRKRVEEFRKERNLPTYEQAFAVAVREDAKTRELYGRA